MGAYEVLAERLGYRESERLRKVLMRLMNEEEAEICASLPMDVEELSKKFGKTKEEMEKTLDSLFRKGLIFMTKKGYQFARNITQLHDATGCDERLDRIWGDELLNLWKEFVDEEWEKARAEEAKRREAPTWRVIPARKAFPDDAKLLPEEDIRAIVEKGEKFAVVPCPCRRIERRCEKPIHVCFQLNRAAEYAITRGTGRELTKEEALKVLELAEEAGLIHSAPNTREVTSVICNCCECCCVIYYVGKKYGVLDKSAAKSRFVAQIDKEKCKGCQTCIERCQFDAIEMVKVEGEKKLKAEVKEENCYGCGLCAVGCEAGAIRMREVRPPEHIPS
ncbi:MAG: (Fe-S)-binding protein [Thermoplasmata archaeon]|nr:MAG: (Fe-S)-binding protein [Thermoplasmata archaeon]